MPASGTTFHSPLATCCPSGNFPSVFKFPLFFTCSKRTWGGETSGTIGLSLPASYPKPEGIPPVMHTKHKIMCLLSLPTLPTTLKKDHSKCICYSGQVCLGRHVGSRRREGTSNSVSTRPWVRGRYSEETEAPWSSGPLFPTVLLA